MINLNPFSSSKGERAGATGLRLQSIRFWKLLENARAINDLFADGIEKIRGDYIFDRHFVVSLVDKVLEKMGMMVFDACVLTPKGGMLLYKLYDEHKKTARQCFFRAEEHPCNAELTSFGSDLPDEPEFKLLAGVLSWINNRFRENSLTVMDFLKLIIDHVISGLDEVEVKFPDTGSHFLRMSSKGVENLFRITDLGGGVTGTESSELSLRDLYCRPLGLMFIGLDHRDSGNDRTGKLAARKWLAVASDEHLSLQSADTRGGVRLEATLGGYVDSDFIFIFVKSPTDPEEFVPEGFRIEKTKLGAVCWTYDVPSSSIENDLIHLGRWLFGTAEL
jgi:hypothetical protein